MQLKINKISLWVVHLSVIINLLLVIIDYTFPKHEEEIFLEHVYTRGFDSRKSKKQVIIEFDKFIIFGNKDIAKVLDKNSENRYYLLKNKLLNNKAFLKVIYKQSNN